MIEECTPGAPPCRGPAIASELIGAHPWRQLAIGVPLGLVAASVAGATQLVYTFAFQAARTWERALALPWPGQPLGMTLQIVAAIVVMRFVANRIANRPVCEFSREKAGRELAVGALIGAGVIGAAMLALAALGVYEVVGTAFDRSLSVHDDISGTLALGRGLLSGLMLGLGSAFGEEVVMRGILLRILAGKFGTLPALTVTSVAFGLLHLGNPHVSVIGALCVAIQAGLLFGVAYLATRRLWLAIGMHAAWNFTQTAIFDLNVSGVSTESSLLIVVVHGPDWLSGGGIGVEGSILTIGFGLIVCGALALVARRRREIGAGHAALLRKRLFLRRSR